MTYLTMHIRATHERKTGHACNACNFTTFSLNILNIHNRNEHKNEITAIINCEMCDFATARRDDLDRHIKNYHRCGVCEFKARDQMDLIKHRKNAHKMKCPTCSFESGYKEAIKAHIEQRHEGKTYQCNQCDHISNHQGSLKIHMNNKHLGVRFECPKCDYKATQRGNLKIHKQAVHDGIVHDCNLCEYKASTKRSVDLHVKSKHWSFINKDLKANWFQKKCKWWQWCRGGGGWPCFRPFKPFYGPQWGPHTIQTTGETRLNQWQTQRFTQRRQMTSNFCFTGLINSRHKDLPKDAKWRKIVYFKYLYQVTIS